MDDLILKAAIWQEEHWIDRSALLKGGAAVRDTNNAVKVVLLSLDRNRESFRLVFFWFHSFDLMVSSLSVRLKARSRQLSAAGEKDLAVILACGT